MSQPQACPNGHAVNPDYADVRVLIVAPNASSVLGGESILPLHYYRQLRAQGVEVWLLVHARRKVELDTLLAHEKQRIFYVPDTLIDRILGKFYKKLPGRLAQLSVCIVDLLYTQIKQRPVIRQLIRQHQITIIHEPIPVSPKAPSALMGLGIPVVMGPMNGGMTYPPGFLHTRHFLDHISVVAGRLAANVVNWLIPGKRRAATVLVANARTRQALPWGIRGRVVELVENAVDFTTWHTAPRLDLHAKQTEFAFVGRLVDWKCVDLLLRALPAVLAQTPAHLTIIGEGGQRPYLEKLAAELHITGNVTFTGWLPQDLCAQRLEKIDALVLPSILECGGSVVLEAMAMGLPIIANNWGGPADYLDESCGILLDPTSPDALVEKLSQAMLKLAKTPTLRMMLGRAGQRRVRENFCWRQKTRQMIEIYQDAIARQKSPEKKLTLTSDQ